VAERLPRDWAALTMLSELYPLQTTQSRLL
jgi:hypothetical protein